jgi:hypothetical protein
MQELIHHLCASETALQAFLCYIEAVHQELSKIARTPAAFTKDTTPERLPEESSKDGKLAMPETLVLPPFPCPRRTPPASLILASNFLQDRCYSDRAWVKLPGLGPREVGRC